MKAHWRNSTKGNANNTELHRVSLIGKTIYAQNNIVE